MGRRVRQDLAGERVGYFDEDGCGIGVRERCRKSRVVDIHIVSVTGRWSVSLSQDRPGMTTRACAQKKQCVSTGSGKNDLRRLAQSSTGPTDDLNTRYSLFIVSREILRLATGLELPAAGDLDPDAMVGAASRSVVDWVVWSNSGKCDERDGFKRYRLLRHLRAVSCGRLTRDASQFTSDAALC